MTLPFHRSALAALALAAGLGAQSPLVQNPQIGATPQPLATPAPPVAPPSSPALTSTPTPPVVPVTPQPLPIPISPARVTPAPMSPAPRAAVTAPPVVQSQPGGLPAPGGDPLRIDPAADPILALARDQSPAGEFRAAVAAAVAGNPGYDEAVATRDEAEASRNEAVARQRPVLDLSVTSFRVIDRNFSNDPLNLLERQRPRNRTDAIARAQQPLVDFGASNARVRAGNERLVAAAANIEDAGTQLALRAVAAWYNVYAYRTLVTLADTFANRQRALRGGVEERIRQGVAAPADLAQVDSYLASADSQRAEFVRALANAQAQFSALTGTPPPATLGRAPTADLAGVVAAQLPADVDGLALVRGARASAQASREEARAARADLFPTVGIAVDAGRYGVLETDNDYDIRGSVNFNWRIGGGNFQREGQARARAAGADARARRIRTEAARDAEIALADVAALEEAQGALADNYLAARRSRDALAERFRVSRGTLIDVVAAEGNYFSVAARYIQTVTELDTARYVLLARTGRLLGALGIDAAGDRR